VLAEALRARILSRELVPGQRLPVEPELSAEYGVSRSTVREALRVLASQNLVTTTRGVNGGSFVAYPKPEQISDYLEASIGLLALSEHLTVDALLEARDLLEVPAAGLAATRPAEARIAELRNALYDPETVQPETVFAYNTAFHLGLLRASGNPLIEVLARPIFSVLNGRFVRERAPARFWIEVDRDHRRILAAVEAGDPAGARLATHEHLRSLRPTYVSIDRSGGGPGDVRSGQAGDVRSGQVGDVRSGQVGDVRSGQVGDVRSGQVDIVRSGQDGAGPRPPG
jgi:GntR family transcriptional regulator, transcriptional repressor for pyruvate dehydrogenase complex